MNHFNYRWVPPAVVVLVTVVLGVAIVAGCIDDAEGSVIDGWAVGAKVPCVTQSCKDLFRVAAHSLDRRDPRHAIIVGMTRHERGVRPNHPGVDVWPGVSIVVFKLLDGTVSAVPAGYPGISRQPMGWADYGPDLIR